MQERGSTHGHIRASPAWPGISQVYKASSRAEHRPWPDTDQSTDKSPKQRENPQKLRDSCLCSHRHSMCSLECTKLLFCPPGLSFCRLKYREALADACPPLTLGAGLLNCCSCAGQGQAGPYRAGTKGPSVQRGPGTPCIHLSSHCRAGRTSWFELKHVEEFKVSLECPGDWWEAKRG